MCYCRWGTCGMWNAGNNYPVQLQPVSRLQTEVFLVAFASLPVSKLQQGLVIFIAISRRILTIINNSFQLCWISWLKAVFWLSSCLKSKWIESIIRLNLGQGGVYCISSGVSHLYATFLAFLYPCVHFGGTFKANYLAYFKHFSI